MREHKNTEQLKKETINLKDLDFKQSELSTGNGDNEYISLSNDLNQGLTNILIEEYIGNEYNKPQTLLTFSEFEDLNLEIGYSLDYSQGSGTTIMKGNISLKSALKILGDCLFTDEIKKILGEEQESFLKDLSFNISHDLSNYYHYNTFNIDNDNCYYYLEKELTNEEQNLIDTFLEDTNKSLVEFFKNICKYLEKYGYEVIEYVDKEQILRSGFRDFLDLNDLNSNLEVYDIDYKEEEEKGYIQIATDGDTCLKGLWIKPFNIEKTTSKVTYIETDLEVIEK